jgi:Holliday junction resolvase
MKSSRKRLGSDAERELCHIFISKNFRVIRSAGSGTLTNSECDIIVANKKKAYCIESKSTRKGGVYIPKDRMNKFLKFAEDTNFTPLVALRFIRENWIFVKPEQFNSEGNTYGITLKKAKQEGLCFEACFS